MNQLMHIFILFGNGAAAEVANSRWLTMVVSISADAASFYVKVQTSYELLVLSSELLQLHRRWTNK